MTFISLDEAKAYLRVDSTDEDAVVGSLLSAAGRLCCDVARLTPEQWTDVDSDKSRSERYTCAELAAVREIASVVTAGYDFAEIELNAGTHHVRMTYGNDGFGDGGDRALFIRKLKVLPK